MQSFTDRGDGVHLAYHLTPGRSPILVFLPGFMSDVTGDKATALAAMAQNAGFACLRLDYSGHGASQGAFTAGTIGRWRDDALHIIDTHTTGPIVLVGSSMGGWIALLVALHRPGRIAALIGIAAAPDFTKTLWAGLSAKAHSAIMHDGEWRVPSPYGGEQVFTRALFDDGAKHLLLDGAIAINAPTHLLQGMHDDAVPWQTALTIAERLSSTQVRVTLIKDGDHRLSRPADLALLCQIAGDFLRADGG